MNLGRRSTLADVAVVVARLLRRADVVAVLTGGACASLYSDGAYQSSDLDFVIRGDTTRTTVDAALAIAGFERTGQQYLHAKSAFVIEFPRGPLAIGDDFEIVPVTLKLPGGSTLALSPTDACRDRLAAFYHWSDRQSLHVAVAIAATKRLNLRVIRRWSADEGFAESCAEFERRVARVKRRRRRR